MKAHLFTLVLLLTACFVSAQDQSFDDLIREGIELHDATDYKEAIKTYKKALKIQPDSKLALYEIAFSYAAMKEYAKSIEYGHKALAAPDDGRDIDLMLYTLIGSNYDDMGKQQEAIKSYDDGLAVGQTYLLHYNKGLTYHRMDSLVKAFECYQNALDLKATHPASNLNIARIYVASNDLVSAFFYYTYFMLLEPHTPRTQVAFDELFATGQGHIASLSNSDQLLLHSVLLTALKSAAATGQQEDTPEVSPYHKLLSLFEAMYAVKDMVKLDRLNDKHCAHYYAPMFFAAWQDGYMELLCRYMTYTFDEDSNAWTAKNEDQIDSFFVWANAFGKKVRE